MCNVINEEMFFHDFDCSRIKDFAWLGDWSKNMVLVLHKRRSPGAAKQLLIGRGTGLRLHSSLSVTRAWTPRTPQAQQTQ